MFELLIMTSKELKQEFLGGSGLDDNYSEYIMAGKTHSVWM